MRLTQYVSCALGLAVTALVVAPTSPSGAPHRPSRAAVKAPAPASAKGFWLVRSGDMSVAEAVDRAVHSGGGRAVSGTLTQMAATASRGRPVRFPGLEGQDTPDLTRSLTALAGRAAREAGVAGPGSAGPAQSPAMSAAAMLLPAVNPVDFTQRGSAISNKMAWSMPFALAGDFCDPTGCVETDRISVKSVTTDPGAATSRANTSVTYFPNHGHFQGAHFQSWVYRGTVNKTGGPGYVNTKTVSSGALTWTIGATASQRGAVIWHGHTMWSRFTPNMQWYRDYARTGNAKCHTTDNVCPY